MEMRDRVIVDLNCLFRCGLGNYIPQFKLFVFNTLAGLVNNLTWFNFLLHLQVSGP